MSSGKMKTLSEHLMDIVPKLQISSKDRKSFSSDAIDISNAIMEAIKKRDSLFRDAFRGLSLTGSVLDKLKLRVPDEFDFHVQLELPFDLTVLHDPKRPGSVFLRAETEYKHPLVTKRGHVNRKLLQKWMRDNFLPVLGSIGTVRCRTSHTYKLEYTLKGYACAHTICATDIKLPSREIWFDFVPAFRFEPSKFPTKRVRSNMETHWFAVPQESYPPDERTFMVCAPHFERNVLHNKHKLKDALRLMKGLRDANHMSHLTSYMLKTVFLHAVDEKHERFWQRSMGVIFSKMVGRLLNDMNRERLMFFLDPGVNHLDRLNSEEIKLFRETISDLLTRLQALKAYGRPVPYAEVAELFNLR